MNADKMTVQEARNHFDKMIAYARSLGDLDSAAKMELAREYFTNPEFRKQYSEYVWNINNK